MSSGTPMVTCRWVVSAASSSAVGAEPCPSMLGADGGGAVWRDV